MTLTRAVRLRIAVGILAFVGTGCATVPQRPAPLSPTMAAWAELRAGRVESASAAFAAILARNPLDAGALFALFNLAFEHGDSAVAFDRALTLVEEASRSQDPLAVSLSTATLSRVSRLLAELPDRRGAEDRVLALRPEALPWQAQYLLALIEIDIARKHADEGLYKRAIARAGCAHRPAAPRPC